MLPLIYDAIATEVISFICEFNAFHATRGDWVGGRSLLRTRIEAVVFLSA